MWRLIPALILFLFSLLVLFRAPTNFTWRLSVAVTEFPHIFIALSTVLLVSCIWAEKYKVLTLGILSVSLLLYAVPIFLTYKGSSFLKYEFEKKFPVTHLNSGLLVPFSVLKMFRGLGLKKIEPISLTYKTTSAGDLKLDFYACSSITKSPCIVVIHGGSWAEGDSKQLADLNSYLANRGYHVAAINYRLAPEYKCPAPIEDVKEALHYLTNKAGSLNIDSTNFILLGRSAGGQIALLSAYTLHNPNIKGVISFYAPADMVYGATIAGNKWVLDTDKVLSDYIGGSYAEVPGKFVKSSPIEFTDKNAPPTLIIHGEHDAMVAYEHSTRLSAKLEVCKVPYYFLSLPCATHGCDYTINGPSGQMSTFAIERFINSVTNFSCKN